MSRDLDARLRRLKAQIPAPPPPRVPEPDVPDWWFGMKTAADVLAALDRRDPEDAIRRRAELDSLSDAELLAEFNRKGR